MLLKQMLSAITQPADKISLGLKPNQVKNKQRMNRELFSFDLAFIIYQLSFYTKGNYLHAKSAITLESCKLQGNFTIFRRYPPKSLIVTIVISLKYAS